MKAVFGEVSQQDVEEWGFECFEVVDDETRVVRHFEHSVEFSGGEEFVISDSCGRYVPFCVESLDALVDILKDLQDAVLVYKAAEECLEDVQDPNNVTMY